MEVMNVKETLMKLHLVMSNAALLTVSGRNGVPSVSVPSLVMEAPKRETEQYLLKVFVVEMNVMECSMKLQLAIINVVLLTVNGQIGVPSVIVQCLFINFILFFLYPV